MARDRASPPDVPSWSRLTEWSLVAGIIVVLILVLFTAFSRQSRVTQGRIELVAVRSMLGSLRTALVIDYLHKKVVAGNLSVANGQRNPFELLERQPPQYQGNMSSADALMAPAGSWVFDPDCDCVGYAPLYAQWFVSPTGDAMAWYRVNGTSGPLQLTAKEAYTWQGESLD